MAVPRAEPWSPGVDVLFGTRLQRYGISAHAGRNTARLALAAELPASVLADLTGISISTAERWSQWAKRDWASYVGQRATIQAKSGAEGRLAGEDRQQGADECRLAGPAAQQLVDKFI